MKCMDILNQDRTGIRNRQFGVMLARSGVQTFIVDDPKVVAFPEIVAEPDIPSHQVKGAVVLNKSVGGQFGIHRCSYPQPGNMSIKLLIPGIKTHAFVFIFG